MEQPHNAEAECGCLVDIALQPLHSKEQEQYVTDTVAQMVSQMGDPNTMRETIVRLAVAILSDPYSEAGRVAWAALVSLQLIAGDMIGEGWGKPQPKGKILQFDRPS